jgi:hypothetical protein
MQFKSGRETTWVFMDLFVLLMEFSKLLVKTENKETGNWLELFGKLEKESDLHN